MNILVCDDDRAIVDAIEIFLSQEGYTVVKAYDGLDALKKLQENEIQLVLMDVMMPGMDGIRTTMKIRETSSVPIIFLSAKSEDVDKILGLNIGADDYITKPFSVEELLARIRVAQRRLSVNQGIDGKESAVFTNGELKIDYTAGCVFLRGEELHLTPIEYKLLCLLSRNMGKVLTHTYITQQVWGRSSENDVASLRVFMATLRKKLEADKKEVQYRQTHIGIGYRMLKIE